MQIVIPLSLIEVVGLVVCIPAPWFLHKLTEPFLTLLLLGCYTIMSPHNHFNANIAQI